MEKQMTSNAVSPFMIEPTQSEETFYPFLFNTHKIKSFKCGVENCDKSYTSKSHLDRHILSVHIKREFDIVHRCPECMRTFSNRQNLKRHLKDVHDPTKSYVCDVCRGTFKKKHQLSAHMYTHTFVKSFSCPLCEKYFVTRLDRKKHMKHHKTYNCDHCSMVFDHWSNYLKHKKTEHTFSEFICDECGRKFKKRGHIVHHLKTHKVRVTPKIHACPYEDCNRIYTRNSNLRQHIKVFHMDIKHVCEICQAKLSTKAKLTKHMLMHTNPKPRSPIKTKATGRKERKDKGIPKTNTALKISGLIVPPKEGDSECSSSTVPPKEGDSENPSSTIKNTPMRQNPKPRKPQKTKATGRKERKDKGIPKTNKALKISSSIDPPEEVDSENSSSYIIVNPLCEAILGLPAP